MININKYEKLRRFPSKKNEVWLIKDSNSYKVLKEYKTQGINNEAYIIQYLQSIGVSTPKIYEKGQNYMVMAYIGPFTLCDYIAKCEKENKLVDNKIIFSLKDQLRLIYQSPLFHEKKMILDDVNLRNFLLKENQVYLIDFEDVTTGDYLMDIGGLAAFFLTYDPYFSDWKIREFKRICKLLKEEYDFDCAAIEDKLIHWLGILGSRRKINFFDIFKEQVATLLSL